MRIKNFILSGLLLMPFNLNGMRARPLYEGYYKALMRSLNTKPQIIKQNLDEKALKDLLVEAVKNPAKQKDYVEFEILKSHIKEHLKQQETVQESYQSTDRQKWQTFKEKFQNALKMLNKQKPLTEPFEKSTPLKIGLVLQRVNPNLIELKKIKDAQEKVDKEILKNVKLLIEPAVSEDEKWKIISKFIQEAYPTHRPFENHLKNYARAQYLKTLAVIFTEFSWSNLHQEIKELIDKKLLEENQTYQSKFNINSGNLAPEKLYKEILKIPKKDINPVTQELAKNKLEEIKNINKK